MDLPDENRRLKKVIDWACNGNILKFSSEIGVSQPRISRLFSIDNHNGKYPLISFEILQTIINKFIEVNSEWLLTGKGEMLKKDSEKKTPEGPPQVQSVPELQQMVIDMQKREISRLQNEIDQLKKEQKLPADHPKPTHSKQ